jgi:hypothetical protein
MGFLITGNSQETILNNCQVAAKVNGYYINTVGTENTVLMTNCSVWEFRDNGIVVDNGSVSIVNPLIRKTAGSGTGINITSNSGKTTIIGGYIKGCNLGITSAKDYNSVYYVGIDFTDTTTPTSSNLFGSLSGGKLGRIASPKRTDTVVAPGANVGELRWELDTGGALKLVAYAGTSTTGVNVVTGVGAGNS